MNSNPKRLFYVKTTERIIGKGTRLYSELTPSENLAAVILSDFEVGEIDGIPFSLITKSAAEYQGCTPRQPHGYSYFYKSTDGIFIHDGNGNLEMQFTIDQGTSTDKGIVVFVGDKLTAVRQPNGIVKNFLKSELKPRMSFIDGEEVRRAQEFYHELEKALHIHKPSKIPIEQRIKPKTAQPMKPLSTMLPKPKTTKIPEPPAAGVRQATPTSAAQESQSKPKQGIFKKFLSGSRKVEHNIPVEVGAHEGQTKLFGVGDLRTLMRAESGQLRWMSTDEVQDELRRRAGQKAAATGEVTHEFKVGQEINFKGEKVKVKDHAHNIIAFERPDGTKGTFKASEYKPEGQEPKQEPQKRTKITEYAQEAATERKKREGQARLSLVPSTEAQGETYQREAERIRTQQTNTEEYKTWRAAADEGWRDNGTFEIEKDVEYDTGEGISIKGTMRQVWNAERKTYDALFNDQSLMLTYGGKNLQLADIEKEKLTLRDPETGESKKIDTIDLDKFNGSLKIDDDGNVSVEKAGKVLGAFQQAAGVTQEDLLSEGTIKVIRDEVWKRTQPKEGAVFNDTYLGRVTRGVAFYRHGDETGILEEGRRGHIVNKNNVRRNVPPEKMSAGLKKLQKLVINTQGRLQEEYHSTFDMNIVKAKMESGGGKSTKPVDRMKYKDVFDKFMGKGKDIQAQVSESYGKPEWTATVDSLAESFKVEDAQRAKEIEAFNSLSKSGMLKAIPEEHSTDDYREAAEELLRGKRDEYLRGKYQETAAERRTGTAKAKFEWGDTSEPPTNAKAVQQKPFKIRDSQNRSYQVQYAIVPMDSVVSSHSIEGQANSEHPTELQARKRGNPMSVQQMQKISADINDDVVQDNADATRGAPVAYSKGGKTYIVQGNGRTTGIKGTKGDQREKYFGMVLNKAKELGLPTEGITENDMLVRVMTPKHTYEDARQLAAYGQESAALPYSEVEYARAYQNAQRLPFQHNVNLEGIGNKPIEEGNVGTFIKNNPELYRKILEQSGKTPEAIQAFPAEQSKVVNTALLAQLNNSFIEDIAGRDDRTHLLVKRLAPTLIDNQKQVTEKKIPEFADLQTMIQRTIKAYDSLDSGTKNAMTIKNGQSEFLTDDPKSETMNSLVHKMRQEDLMSAAGKEANIFRDPLHVIGLMAYHQAVAPKQTQTAQEQSMAQYALKVRRFNDAIQKVTGEQEDIFGATQTPQEKEASQRDKILKIAEMIFLQNKPYRSGEEQLTPEEQEAAKEQYPAFDVLKKMRTAASSHGFALSGEKLSKSMKIIPRIFQNIFRTKHQKQFEIIKRIAQMELFGGNTPMEGETKSFGAKDLRRFDKMKGRWVDADEYNQTHVGTPHAGQRQEIVEHKAKRETQANVQKEPTLNKYFVMKPDTKIIPIADLEQTHEPDTEKQGRAKKHMQNASLGLIPKRNPISVVDAGKKKHVIDGNSTVEVAKTLGLQQIPATVLDTIDKGRLPQFLDAYKKLEEVAGGVQQTNINQLKRAALKKVYGEWRKEKTQSYPELAGKRLFRGDGYDLIFSDDGELDIVKQNHSIERQQVKLWKEYDRPKELRNKVKENKGDEAVTELMALAEKHKTNFEKGLKAVCEKAGVQFNQEMFDNFGTKSHESMKRKIHSAEKEQKLALYGAQYVNDALRYTFEISKWDDVQGIYDQLIGNEKETGFKILDDTVDNKFANPTEEGYRDLSMVLRVNDEITAEVQINFKALNDAKLGEGHRMYEQLRELKHKVLTERSSENVSQIRAQINSIVDKSRKFYESVLNSVISKEQAVNYSIALRKSIGNWFNRFFKTQLDMFGAKPKPQATGIKWDKKMQEKPNHKYIRRYKGKDGEWRYVYREGEREYVGDAKGKELPKHHDWQTGDKVTYDGKEAIIHQLADTYAVIRTADGKPMTVPIGQIEHYTETQKKLLGNRAEAVDKYQSLIDEYEEDLKNGADDNKYELADSKAELERKIKYAKEEKAKHENKEEYETATDVVDVELKKKPDQTEAPLKVAETLNPYGQPSLFGDNPEPIKASKTTKRIKIGKDELLMDEILAPEAGTITETSTTDRDLVSVELKKTGTVKISGRKINSPEDIAYLCRRLADSAVEKFVIVPVDKDMKPLTIDVVTIGLLNSSLVHPREALRTAVELGANGIIAVHNHPSGNSSPSIEDKSITSQIAAAAKYAGIVFHGHVVLGGQGRFTHMDETGTINDEGTVSNATKTETTVPIYQKEIKRSGQQPEAANAPEDLVQISRRLTGGKTGVWLLTHDSNNKVVGAHQLRADVGSYDIKSYKKIVQGIVRNNAASASIYIAMPPQKKTGLQVAEGEEKSNAKQQQMREDLVEETAKTYRDMFKVLGVQFLDVLAEVAGKKGTTYGLISAAERQMMRSVGSFIMNLFKAPTHGQTKQFGLSDLRKFDANRHRWIDADEWRKLNPPNIETPTTQEKLFTDDKTVEMKASDYLEEHTKLIATLKEGDPEKLKAEAADQSKEVKEQADKLKEKTPKKKIQLDNRKIKKIISVVDTREYECVGSEHGKDIFKPIIGSGTVNQCDRCGKDHEVHATVALDDGSEIVVGTGCMKTEFGKLAETIGSMANTVMTIKKHEAKLDQLEKEKAETDKAWKTVKELKIPKDRIRIEETIKDNHKFAIAKLDDAQIFVSGGKENYNKPKPYLKDVWTDEEKLIEEWQTNRLNNILKRKYANHYSTIINRISREKHYAEEQIEKLNKKLELVKKEFAEQRQEKKQ